MMDFDAKTVIAVLTVVASFIASVFSLGKRVQRLQDRVDFAEKELEAIKASLDVLQREVAKKQDVHTLQNRVDAIYTLLVTAKKTQS